MQQIDFASERVNPPIIIDESGMVEYIKKRKNISVSTLDECRTGNIPGVWMYEREEEKKEFSISAIRGFLKDIWLAPYEGKNIYILRDFDTASIEAQNAVLKVLEDCPTYAEIFLVVENPELLIETIQSRTLTIHRWRKDFPVNTEVKQYLESFFRGEKEEFMRFLFAGKFERDEAIGILAYAARHDRYNQDEIYSQWIEDIQTTNESAKNILENIFLCERKEK